MADDAVHETLARQGLITDNPRPRRPPLNVRPWHPPLVNPSPEIGTVNHRVALALPIFEWRLLVGACKAAAVVSQTAANDARAGASYNNFKPATDPGRDEETAAKILERIATHITRALPL